MSEFIAAMDSSNGYNTGEHSVRRVLAGDAETVRRRLVNALESLGYTVVSENPLQARRARLKNPILADFSEHSRKLSVSLRQVGESATSAVFDFAVVHAGCMTKGDRRTLEREVDAIVAVAEAPAPSSVCRSCGTENGPGARFCRQCGAPCAAGAPAELEVLRLTAGSRAALQELVGGLLIAFLSLACMLPLILYGNPKGIRAGLIILAVGELVGWLMALYGLLRLYRTVNHRGGEGREEGRPAAALPSPREVSALPPRPERFSVTEGATELLGATPLTREKATVPRERPDTNPFK